jgi:hypothetical protein
MLFFRYELATFPFKTEFYLRLVLPGLRFVAGKELADGRGGRFHCGYDRICHGYDPFSVSEPLLPGCVYNKKETEGFRTSLAGDRQFHFPAYPRFIHILPE